MLPISLGWLLAPLLLIRATHSPKCEVVEPPILRIRIITNPRISLVFDTGVEPVRVAPAVSKTAAFAFRQSNKID